MTSLKHSSRWHSWADRLGEWSFRLIVMSLSIWLILGLLAAIFGGPLTNLGSGFGGVWGVPGLVFLFATLLALPSFLIGFADLFQKQAGAIKRMLVYGFSLLIAFGYVFIAHGLDPCFLGIWHVFSKLGSIRLCEQFGGELNIHTRFHLLWHVLPTLPLVGIYWFAYKRGMRNRALVD